MVFRAWTEPDDLARWRGSPGWHVETDTVSGELRLGGRHHHVKVRDNDPSTRVTTDGVFTEFFDPDVFVARERITGDPGIDPDAPLELRVEFTQTTAATARCCASSRALTTPTSPATTARPGRRSSTRLAAFLSEAEADIDAARVTRRGGR